MRHWDISFHTRRGAACCALLPSPTAKTRSRATDWKSEAGKNPPSKRRSDCHARPNTLVLRPLDAGNFPASDFQSMAPASCPPMLFSPRDALFSPRCSLLPAMLSSLACALVVFFRPVKKNGPRENGPGKRAQQAAPLQFKPPVTNLIPPLWQMALRSRCV